MAYLNFTNTLMCKKLSYKSLTELKQKGDNNRTKNHIFIKGFCQDLYQNFHKNLTKLGLQIFTNHDCPTRRVRAIIVTRRVTMIGIVFTT